MTTKQCIKIDIYKKEVTLPATANAITARRLNGVFYNKNKARPSYAPADNEPELEYIEEKYQLREFKDPSGTFYDANFLVKTDELGIFTQLLLLQSQNMRQMLEEYEVKGYKRGFDEGNKFGDANGRGALTQKIKALPWWKRLTNNF